MTPLAVGAGPVLGAAPVAPLPGAALLVLLAQCAALLATATVLGRLAARCRLPAVTGELCAGIVLGPTVLPHVAPGVAQWLFPHDPAPVHLLDAVTQLGVLLFVGLTGIHCDLGLIRRSKREIAAVGLGGLTLPLLAGLGVGLLLPASMFGPTAEPAVRAGFLGVALCVSAIPVIAKILADLKLLHRDVAQLSLGAALLDDIAGWLLLSVVSMMATTGVRAGDLAVALTVVVAFLLASATVAPVALGAILRAVGRTGDQGATTAAVVTMILSASAAAVALGLEAVFGAFLCGLAISASGMPVAESLRGLRTVVSTVLAPLFFATAGLRMDLGALARPAVLGTALLVLAVAVGGKFLGVFVGAFATGLDRWQALALAGSLNARGVIQVIIALTGLRLGVLSPAMYTVIVLVAIATSAMAAPCLRYAAAHLPTTARERARAEDVPTAASGSPAPGTPRPDPPPPPRSSRRAGGP
ncbi:cation:proton antiporter [Streptomyces sp. NPDC096205]|uniref:cation:proton antiporter n=1 Tax=Streptomyces sp. NPDC096205 TaxID=3366081 RepID=UPI0038240D7E